MSAYSDDAKDIKPLLKRLMGASSHQCTRRMHERLLLDHGRVARSFKRDNRAI